MELSAKEIAKIINAEIFGDNSLLIKGVSSFEDSNVYDITFASDSKFLNRLEKTGAGAVIVPQSHSVDMDSFKNIVLLKVENPKISFFKLLADYRLLKLRLYPIYCFSNKFSSACSVSLGVFLIWSAVSHTFLPVRACTPLTQSLTPQTTRIQYVDLY